MTQCTHAATWHQVDAMGAGGAFGIYCAASILGGLFTYRYVPETSGLRLEQTGALFDDPYPSTWRASPQPESVTRGGAGAWRWWRGTLASPNETTALLSAPAKRQGAGI